MLLMSRAVAGVASAAILAAGVVIAPAVNAAPAPTVNTSVAVSMVTSGSTFKAKTVKVYVPTKFFYTRNIGKTTIISTTVKKVTAKKTGSIVYVKIGGKWKKVPYVYSKATNSLKYDEKLRIKYGLAKDPLGASKAANMYPNDPVDGGDKPIGSGEEIENPNPPSCDPASQLCNYVPGGGTWNGTPVPTGSYDTNPAAVAVAGGNYGGEMLAGINNVRAGAGLPPLAWCPAAAQAATGWANYLSATGLFAHNANGSDPATRMMQVGAAMPFGENLAAGYSNASAAIGGWNASPSHLAIMKNPVATHVGVGIAPSPTYGGVIWVANFTGRAGACQ